MVVFGFGERINGGVPIGHITYRGIEGKAQSFLFVDPFFEITRGTASCNDGVSVVMQPLANCGSDTTHASCDVRYFFAHELSPVMVVVLLK